MMIGSRQPGLLAVDIGTSSIRVTICTKNEGIKGRYTLKQEVNARFPIDTVWDSVSGLIREGMKLCSDIQIEAIGISAFLGWVVIDENGTPVDQAWSWSASGDSNEVGRYMVRLPEAAPRLIGRAVNEELGVFKWGKTLRTRQKTTVLSIKDYFNYKLTGVLKMDRAHASYTGLFSIRRRAWEMGLIKTYDLPESSVPPLGDGNEEVGLVLAEVATELGLPENVRVALCGPDGTLAILGGGGWKTGQTVEVMGTTDVCFHVTEHVEDVALVSSGLIQNCHVIPGLYAVGGPTGMTGGAIAWLMKQMNWTFECDGYRNMLHHWEKSIPAAEGLFVIPSLTGARVPDWNPFICGTIVGLRPSHTKADIFKATVEGIAFGTRRILERLERFVVNDSVLVAIGGGSKNEKFLQTRSAVSGRTIRTVRELEASTVGVFALAGVLVNWFDHVGDAISELNPIEHEVSAKNTTQAMYADLYGEYNRLYQWIENWYGNTRNSERHMTD